MLQPNLLIFGSSQDAHVQTVLTKLTKDTVPFVCQLSEFTSEFAASVEIAGNSNSAQIRYRDGSLISLQHLKSIWWWRPGRFPLPRKSALADHFYTEFSHFWTGVMAILPREARWFNHFHAESMASSKLYQLATAVDCGLAVPHTLITSDPARAKRFAKEHEHVVFKGLLASDVIWRPTQLLTKELLRYLDHVFVSPVIFQEYVDANLEYRVTIIDDDVHSVAFDLTDATYRYDVRIDVSNPRRRVELPASLTDPLKKFMRVSGLRYGVFELRERTDGAVIFLELNPAGEFLFLDVTAKTQIAETLATALSARNGVPSQDSQASTEFPIDIVPDKPFLLCTPKIPRRFP